MKQDYRCPMMVKAFQWQSYHSSGISSMISTIIGKPCLEVSLGSRMHLQTPAMRGSTGDRAASRAQCGYDVLSRTTAPMLALLVPGTGCKADTHLSRQRSLIRSQLVTAIGLLFQGGRASVSLKMNLAARSVSHNGRLFLALETFSFPLSTSVRC